MPLPFPTPDAADLTAAPARTALLASLKAWWQAERAEIEAEFRADLDGVASSAAIAALTDRLVAGLFALADTRAFPAANPTRGEVLSLLALGGYGRSEMAPYSDIDLLFLLPWKATPRTEQIAEWMLYLLWDMGLKVGHSVRSAEECLRLADSDTTVRTALLEARPVAGQAEPAEELLQRFRSRMQAGERTAFTRAKLEERDKRHRRLGDSRYLLEPDIKDGKGGLRDLHTLLWIARDRYGGNGYDGLVKGGLLTPGEARRFMEAQRFLLQLRTALHFTAGRAEDRLSFEYQPAVAALLRYRDGGAQQRPAARLMRHYFLVARDLGFLTGVILARLDPDAREEGLRPWFSFARPVQGFAVRAGIVQPVPEGHFAVKPLDLIRVFRVAQAAELRMSPLLVAQVARAQGALVPALRQDFEANRLLVEILEGPQPDAALRAMSDTGVLGRFVPDWARVTAQTQHDFYHVYTVDEHTLVALGLLDGLRRGRPAPELAAVETLAKALSPASYRTLAVTLFLHDIAKGRGGDHSILGAEVAEQLCPRFGLPPEQVETVAWAVRQHLTMSAFAQRRDPTDPQTLQDFSDIVQSRERLRLLYILTLCDIRAVGPGRLTDWKRQLLAELYRQTDAALSGGFADRPGPSDPAELEALLAPLLPGWSAERRAAHAARLPPAYWRHTDAATLAAQAQLMAEVQDGARPFGLLRQDDSASATSDVTVYAPDRPGLFAGLAGALALAGASIVDARAFTIADGWALDSFRVQSAQGTAFAGEDRLARLEGAVADMLADPTAAAARLAELRRSRAALPARVQGFPVEPRVLVDNTASATFTVVEINGQDRPGLLYDIASAMTREGVQIASARIATFGTRAVDVFYIKDRSGVKLLSPRALARLREVLLAALHPESA